MAKERQQATSDIDDAADAIFEKFCTNQGNEEQRNEMSFQQFVEMGLKEPAFATKLNKVGILMQSRESKLEYAKGLFKIYQEKRIENGI